MKIQLERIKDLAMRLSEGKSKLLCIPQFATIYKTVYPTHGSGSEKWLSPRKAIIDGAIIHRV